MKIKKAVISLVVSAALVGGAVYGAYFVLQNRKTAVEVVSVENLNQNYGYWWDFDDTIIYGSVTSQVAQTVDYDDTYAIEKIYVNAGDTVKEGDPLFSYDMTLPELELEMAELSLQSQELTLTKLEKDLEKLQSGKSLTAVLDDIDNDYTMSAEEEDLPEVLDDETVTVEEQAPSGSGSSSDGGIFVEGVEPAESDKDLLQIADSVLSFEQLVNAIDILFRTNGDVLVPEDVGEALEDSIRYYRKRLAEKTVVSDTDENGNPVEVTTYVTRDDVKAALGEEDAQKLETYVETLKKYALRYEEMLLEQGQTTWKYSWNNAGSYVDDDTEAPDDISGAEGSGTMPGEEETSGGSGVSGDDMPGGSGSLPEEDSSESDPGALPDETDPSENESETSAGETAPSENETETVPDESETANESETSSETSEPSSEESESQAVYVVTVIDGDEKKDLSFHAGDLVAGADELTARGDVLKAFERWEVQPRTLTYTTFYDKVTDSYSIEFTMPAEDVVIEKIYTLLPEVIQTYIDGFTSLEEKARALAASDGTVSQEYLSALETAVCYYQDWLSEVGEEVFTEEVESSYESYVLKDSVREYLESVDRSDLIETLPRSYKELCLMFGRSLYDSLDMNSLDHDRLEMAQKVYDLLGDGWRTELEAQWLADQPEGTAQTMGDRLKAYGVLQMYQSFLNGQSTMTEPEKLVALQGVMAAYWELTEVQQAIVEAYDTFIDTMRAYGLWEDKEPLTEPETEPYTGDWYDGYDGYGGYDGSSDLANMIDEVKQEIKSCELSIREKQLVVSQKQRVVDKKVVTSTLNGVVMNIGETDGSSDYDYFVKVASESGLYARGAMSELELEQINIGDTISGTLTDTGEEFTAVIKIIAEYPDASGESTSFFYNSGNSNVSYYPFYALLDDSEDIEEGEAEIRLTPDTSSGSDSIYLENCYVRKENSGKSYVYKQAEDGTLTKQYVVTGKSLYSYAIEIVSGLETTDKIAFPYGKSVKEGAPTKEVDSLSYY